MSLLIVHINPEQRVRVERGSHEASLVCGSSQLFGITVYNEARTTAILTLRVREHGPRDRWLQYQLVGGGQLTGEPRQSLVLELATQAQGKREALFQAEVGPETQELGALAELAVLFCVHSSLHQTPAPVLT